MNYKVIGQNFYDSDGYENGDMCEFYGKQMELFNGSFLADITVVYHFFDSAFRNEMYTVGNTVEINDYIEMLAIKDGVNLVKYENGNTGFVGIYNGHENGFEIIPLTETQIKAFNLAEMDPCYGVDYTESETVKQLLTASEKDLLVYIAE